MSRPDEAPAEPPAGGEVDGARDAAAWSVVVCTYRGARYLPDQLGSIFAARPGCAELILVDDASGDDTLAVASRAIDDWGGRAIVEVNPVNLGSLRSFEKGLRLATGPLIFLADQDDVWRADKPARMLAAFAARPDLLLLHSDARIVDDAARPLGYTVLQAIEASLDERSTIHHGDAFDAFVRRNLATGATIAFRRELLDAALPIPDGWVHDEWLATIASAIGRVDFLDEPLIDYRQHASNQIGARKLSWRMRVEKAFGKSGDYYARQLVRAEALLERLVALGPRVPPDRLDKVRRKLLHLKARAALPRNRLARLWPIAGQWLSGGYRRYSTGMKSIVRDLFHGH